MAIFLGVLWATWVLGSYVLGRYQGVVSLRSPATSFVALQGLVKTTLVVSFSLAGTLTYLWLFKSSAGNSLFRSFLIPYLGSLGLLSFLVQILLGSWVRNKRCDLKQWHFLGVHVVYKRLQHHLQWSRIQSRLNYLDTTNYVIRKRFLL